MKHLLFCFAAFWFSSHSLLAQSNKIIHFGAQVNPKYSMPVLKESELIFPENTFNYSVGADVFYDVNSAVQLYSGVNFSRLSGKQIDYWPFLECDAFDPAGPLNSWFEDVFTLHYLGIPVGAKLKIAGEENHLYAKIGLEAMFKISDKSETIFVECDPPGRVIRNNFFVDGNSLLLNGNLGLGFEIALSKELKLILEPEIEYTLNTIFEDVTINTEDLHEQRIFNIGIVMGVRF